ncbi:MAG: AbrB/MazE/SpoVT family DNA-binding domain-containing protein [Nitrospirae bacterium]|nr:AbrB/MazE/SpoVT family DNA-binding domain-containing protein [Nitrospirota bacterium]
MKTNIVPVGNSRGIRIPKVMLKECNIEDKVEMEREGRRLIIMPVRSYPRQGWEKAFSRMHKKREDALLLDEGVEELEALEWK